MVEVARRLGVPAYLVPDVTEFDESWLEGVSVVGLSAGASAPEILVDQVLERLADFGYRDIEIEQVAQEDVVFHPPTHLIDTAKAG
jgi:4-hydroxy-3-methylbut-2-enyl diphosphate reductase